MGRVIFAAAILAIGLKAGFAMADFGHSLKAHQTSQIELAVK
jgi:hypothetical protein